MRNGKLVKMMIDRVVKICNRKLVLCDSGCAECHAGKKVNWVLIDD